MKNLITTNASNCTIRRPVSKIIEDFRQQQAVLKKLQVQLEELIKTANPKETLSQ